MEGAVGLCEGDIVECGGCAYCVNKRGGLDPVEEVLAKRFDGDDGDVTTGIRRALLQGDGA